MSATRDVHTGLDRLAEEASWRDRLAGRRVGLLVNQASVTRRLEHAVDLLGRLGFTIARLFGPEHGLWGHAQDMESVGHGVDTLTGLPVVSLYGHTLASLSPDGANLAGLDAIVIDLPDIGTRYYTFAASALYLARAAQAAGIEVWVLDRPNPIGGVEVEGNLILPGFQSFVGAISVPNRHGLTLAELLRYANRFQGDGHGGDPAGALTVVPAAGWERGQWLDQTGLPWVAPSPNMPRLETAAIYPGMCLLEATNVSEGRGTTLPFEVFGAPWVDAVRLCHGLDELALAGVHFRPLAFKPMFQKWGGQICQGAQVHVVDRPALEPYRLGLAVLWALRHLFPEHFAWRDQPYEFVTERPAIDLLCGTDAVRQALESGAELDAVCQSALAGAEVYPERRRAITLY